jgi:hypothetical protein
VHIGLKPLTFDHILEVIVLSFLCWFWIFFYFIFSFLLFVNFLLFFASRNWTFVCLFLNARFFKYFFHSSCIFCTMDWI